MRMSSARANPFRDLPVMNPSQLGGIETSVLDNGPGRGVRIAWINTGGGLRYKVVIDRGLDIADAEFLGQSLTWHSLVGVTAPAPHHHGIEWLRGFGGGLLVGCGPLNVGDPFTEAGQEFGLHGTHSNTPATIESIINPDPTADRVEMSITGLVRTARVFGPNVELRRTIRSTLGEPAIHVHDVFVNRGNQPAPHAWLLHVNFGYPLLEPSASTFCYRGTLAPLGDAADWFKPDRDYRAAVAPQEAHRGMGEVVTYIDPEPGPDGIVLCGAANRKRRVGVMVEYPASEFPHLGNWQHWGPEGSYVGALEPMTASVEGRAVDRERDLYRELQPGGQVEYHCTLTATTDPADLERLLAMNQ